MLDKSYSQNIWIKNGVLHVYAQCMIPIHKIDYCFLIMKKNPRYSSLNDQYISIHCEDGSTVDILPPENGNLSDCLRDIIEYNAMHRESIKQKLDRVEDKFEVLITKLDQHK